MWSSARISRFKLHKSLHDVNRTVRAVVRRAASEIPFYARLLNDSGVNTASFGGLDDLPSLPVVRREALPLDAALRDALSQRIDPRKCVTALTSGSDGVPIRVFMSPAEALYRRLLLAMAWYRAMPIRFPCTIIDVGVRPDLLPFTQIRWRGPFRLVHVPLATFGEADLSFLSSFRGEILAGYPSSLAVLAECLGSQRVFLSPKCVATRGEVLSTEARVYLEKTFSAPVVDFYNCEQVGNVAWQCPSNPSQMHVNTDACVLEIVDESDRPLPDGQIGRILLTNLYNCTMPFIRYDIQDQGFLIHTSREACTCGSHASRIGLVQGRDDDFVILTNGSRVSPRLMATTLEQAVDALQDDKTQGLPFRRYQITQDASDHITIRMVPLNAPDEQTEVVVERAIHRLDPNLRCAIKWTADLPTASSGKLKKITRQISSPVE